MKEYLVSALTLLGCEFAAMLKDVVKTGERVPDEMKVASDIVLQFVSQQTYLVAERKIQKVTDELKGTNDQIARLLRDHLGITGIENHTDIEA